ncbi:hypothetical protein COLO4_01880 [Corchorus olitorius]|uniref:Uncharacterized protein n=1 Tax=Corchorus olitorius TaxID=93759 RepID=A0A1R3L220_9ROSI|nr:hypothetical protein COLO4_01880 [Corchorus olitorius]
MCPWWAEFAAASPAARGPDRAAPEPRIDHLFPDAEQRQHAQHQKDQRRNPMHQRDRHARSELVAHQYCRHVGEQHADSRARHDREHVVKARGQCHGRDLRLVAHLGKEERNDGRPEDAKAALRRRGRFVVVELVRNQHPAGHGDKAHAQDPPQHVFPQHVRDPATDGAGQCVVDEGGDEDAENDRYRLAKTRGQQDRQQLRLVADFCERDDAGGDEKGFHVVVVSGPRVTGCMDGTLSAADHAITTCRCDGGQVC